MTLDDAEAFLATVYIRAEGARLRKEDRKKAEELAALFAEVARAAGKGRGTIVDAAAGKGYVGLLCAARLPRCEVVLIEREPVRARAIAEAAAVLGAGDRVSVKQGDVGDPSLWPEAPLLVTALHACGEAADGVMRAAARARARRMLVVPCCTRASGGAESAAESLGLARHAAVRAAFRESFVASERALRLEAAGYETEIVPFVPTSVSPYNLLFRARRVGEPGRMREAEERLRRMGANPRSDTV